MEKVANTYVEMVEREREAANHKDGTYESKQEITCSSVHERTIAQPVDRPVLLFQEEIVEVNELVPQEWISEKFCEQTVDALVPQEQVQQVLERSVDVPVPQIMKSAN